MLRNGHLAKAPGAAKPAACSLTRLTGQKWVRPGAEGYSSIRPSRWPRPAWETGRLCACFLSTHPTAPFKTHRSSAYARTSEGLASITEGERTEGGDE